ncbi:MAG TPA: glycosyltransferase [Anaerolineales bacterium]|nr:glycosyltransferase [Anaerolineales bacterium]
MIFQNLSQRLRILTWHIHSSYLYYLVQSSHEFFLPVKPGRPEGYAGRTEDYSWPENVHEVPAEEIQDLELDCVLFQSRQAYLEDQFEILSESQQALPRIYLEHDPPAEHPTDTRHPVDDPNILLVHVTHFNDLMWEHGSTPTKVIEHGVLKPEGVRYTGEMERGLVIVNDLHGRRLGLDIFESVRRKVPLDLVGMNAEELGGLASPPHQELLELESHYRFVFNPIRYSSLGMAICEAMMVGLPIIGFATTEMATAIENGLSGYVDTNVSHLVEHMQRLLSSPMEAHRLGAGARLRALQRFNIQRFASDWDNAFASITGLAAGSQARHPQEMPV